MGHALNNTLQDILVRWRRLQGHCTLWVPGTDHAGIATQAVVERRLREEEGKTRHDLGREKLVERIWAWKDDYERRILNQLRRLGASCDWQRTRFTLDDTCARAVRATFFSLFCEGLIYRGKRLVNWDVQLQTAVADDEVFHETVQGSLWTLRYPVKDSGETILIATTRPETMLGDTAVAVHPDDARYRHLIGHTVLLPLVDREIPLIADPVLVDPKFGTGAVKVTPAHDPNDYACAQRNALPMINILDPDGTINANGGAYQGLSREEARRRVVADLQAKGLVEKIDPYETEIGHSDRSKTAIEPYLSDQWFVAMADLAQNAMDAVTDGRVRIHPPRYAKTYLDWLGEKRDWCISRQLWWGHRIPIWYCATCSEDDLRDAFGDSGDVCWRRDAESDLWLICAKHDLSAGALGPKHELTQDPDVLDTWFSSALWPHSTLGWPEKTPELEYFYPTSALVTSRDIITLWVARMVVAGLHNCGDVPFRDVYIHPKILDGQGQTMSKSKGNGVDPLDIIDAYGADALRFTLAHLTTEQQDVRMPVAYLCPHCGASLPQTTEHQQLRAEGGRKPRLKCKACRNDYQPSSPNFDPDPGEPVGRLISDRFELGRNFANKLWNASRFVMMNLDDYLAAPLEPQDLAAEDRWILSRLRDAALRLTDQLEGFRFSEAARALYDFTWSEFCDWYVEMLKPRLRDADMRPAAQRMLAGVLDCLLRLLHPVMPFVTEEIWQRLAEVAPERGLFEPAPAAPSVLDAAWPKLPEAWADSETEQQIARLQAIVTEVRNKRATLGVAPRSRTSLFVRTSREVAEQLRSQTGHLEHLTKTTLVEAGPAVRPPADSASFALAELEGHIPLGDLIDVDAERDRQRKKHGELEQQIRSREKKLANPQFVEKAPADVVDKERALVVELRRQGDAVAEILRQLGGA
jgi:valyl-tRNA synthetase